MVLKTCFEAGQFSTPLVSIFLMDWYALHAHKNGALMIIQNAAYAFLTIYLYKCCTYIAQNPEIHFFFFICFFDFFCMEVGKQIL